ncbi:MAG TPA: poly-beta-1,6-N-acetyl-D-glucosamine biosynthesis protein PgaD [Steroidobacteraceae bacterium]|nr:poly-beta-1,6-N-acetyl-D-glucosamine biosynthesis protein PgaD [Steroidobacteraceae bacterium]
MSEKMIINARRELGWRRRILSDGITVVLWVLWIALWIPVYDKLHEVIQMRMSFEPAAEEVFEAMDPIDVSNSLFALLGTTGLLLLWTLLPRRKVTRAHELTTLEDYAAAFQLPAEEITAGRASRVAVVHHDEAGAIVQIETRA